jgi:hypothetical protein
MLKFSGVPKDLPPQGFHGKKKIYPDTPNSPELVQEVKHVQEGGNNTKYFHLIANKKHRKNRISQLEQDEGTIVVEEKLKVYIIEYYKKLFGAPIKNT